MRVVRGVTVPVCPDTELPGEGRERGDCTCMPGYRAAW